MPSDDVPVRPVTASFHRRLSDDDSESGSDAFPEEIEDSQDDLGDMLESDSDGGAGDGLARPSLRM